MTTLGTLVISAMIIVTMYIRLPEKERLLVRRWFLSKLFRIK